MAAQAVVLFLIDFVFGVVEFFIGFRIILKLLGASTRAPFVNWIYETSQPLIAPFVGMFSSPRLAGGFVVEFSALFGLLVYGLVAYAMTELVRFVGFQATRYQVVKSETVVERRGRRGRRG